MIALLALHHRQFHNVGRTLWRARVVAGASTRNQFPQFYMIALLALHHRQFHNVGRSLLAAQGVRKLIKRPRFNVFKFESVVYRMANMERD